MASAFLQLLNGVIGHLEIAKASGQRWVTISPAALDSLRQPLARIPATAPARRSAPVSPPAPVRAPDPAPPPVPVSRPASPKPVAAPPPPVPVAAPMPPAPAPAPVATSPARIPHSREAREAGMQSLCAQVLACEKCVHLVKVRHNVVFGVGDIHSELMFVGEAPGEDEDLQGEPFVGKAGVLLTKIIQTMGFSRQTVYIANILKCRPDTPGQSAGNRKPTSEEMAVCFPYLKQQIDWIQPRLIVALGATAVAGLLGNTTGITRLRGHWQSYQGIPVMPTFHPSYLLHNQALSERRKVWEDMLLVLERLERPISDKQRAFFLAKG